MTTFRFLHTADLHLGSPFQGGAKRLSDAWLKQMRVAAETVLDRIVAAAIEHDAEFITIAGDLFDTDKAAMSAHFALLRGFLRLQDAGIQVVLTHGNHDPLRSDELPLQWPSNVHVLGACERTADGTERAPSLRLATRDGSSIQISGFSYTRPDMRRPMHDAFSRDGDVDFAIGLYHGVVDEAGPHENYCPTQTHNLIRRNFDFWGLGHVHQFRVLQQSAPTVVYPGTPQGRHAKEQGLHGCMLVDVQSRGNVEMQFVETSEVVWQDIDVDVSTCDHLTEVLLHCAQQLQKMLPQAPTKVVTTVTLTGSTSAHVWLHRDLETINSLAEELMLRLPHVWIVDVHLQTNPLVDVAQLTRSQEFIGDFLRLCEHYTEDLKSARQDLGPLLAEVFHAANDLPVESLTDDEMRDLILQARGYVLEFVGEEELS